ncbi:PREDICTED: uncharacterized protein LOC108759576 [Trachymyrmex cornetzi]|uniref:uncharacterized protein LOC108759576 n=1 Tax=Trachymyrmex cornetzi TaxID=471704 RepID=UPI00084F80B6|nr:PREDICTED: uncharacterized protein LOC108759576 [Trachymyrmex cornetzi]
MFSLFLNKVAKKYSCIGFKGKNKFSLFYIFLSMGAVQKTHSSITLSEFETVIKAWLVKGKFRNWARYGLHSPFSRGAFRYSHDAHNASFIFVAHQMLNKDNGCITHIMRNTERTFGYITEAILDAHASEIRPV